MILFYLFLFLQNIHFQNKRTKTTIAEEKRCTDFGVDVQQDFLKISKIPTFTPGQICKKDYWVCEFTCIKTTGKGGTVM